MKKTTHASSFFTFQLTTIIVQILTCRATTRCIFVVVFNQFVADLIISLFEGKLLMQDSILPLLRCIYCFKHVYYIYYSYR